MNTQPIHGFELPPALSALGAHDQFIVYQLVPSATRPGKTDKLPIDHRTGFKHDAHDPAIWMDVETAAAMALACGATYGDGFGVGFVFTLNDPFFFIDIDDCAVDGTWSPTAQVLMQRFNGAAVEISASGRGLHIIGTGNAGPPPPARKVKYAQWFDLYTENRFVALTGNGIVGDAATVHTPALTQIVREYLTPDTNTVAVNWDAGPVPRWRGPTDDNRLIERALKSKSGKQAFGSRASFRDLWENNEAELAKHFPETNPQATRPYDASSADAALAQRLAYWTGNDCERIRRIMPLSELKRDKWDREDYLSRTILGCVARQHDVLEDKLPEAAGVTGGRRSTQADALLELAQLAELFHAPDCTGYADVYNDGHRETWRIRSKGFRRWLEHRFFETTHGAPSSEALKSALSTIEAKAHFNAPERIVHVRVGDFDSRLYLDLCDEAWRAVEIDAAGWRVIEKPPIRFRRERGMKPIPIPISGGSIATLRSFLNVQSDADFVLIVAWALAALRGRGPYPVIVLSGEQGSAKSTFSAVVRSLLDPNTAPLRALPREDRDFFIAANNSHLLAFDNVSGLPPWTSDTLCRLATGGGFAVRQLYSDQDETLFDAARPIILNGIEDIVTRPDLADRALLLKLEPISDERRLPEKEFWESFETERPRILGVLLDAVVEGQRRLAETHLPKLPRMADFAKWATACETALWPAGTFWSAYRGNRDEAVDRVLDADPIAAAVRTLMATRSEWVGTASDLLGVLAAAGVGITNSRAWPANPRALSGRLTRAANFLRAVGIDIRFDREGHNRSRVIRITTILKTI